MLTSRWPSRHMPALQTHLAVEHQEAAHELATILFKDLGRARPPDRAYVLRFVGSAAGYRNLALGLLALSGNCAGHRNRLLAASWQQEACLAVRLSRPLTAIHITEYIMSFSLSGGSATLAATLASAGLLAASIPSSNASAQTTSAVGSAQTLAPITVRDAGGGALDPVEGYTATSALSASKTDTPLIETPQSVTVITADQIRDQGAQGLQRSEEHTSELQSRENLVCRLLLEKKKDH